MRRAFAAGLAALLSACVTAPVSPPLGTVVPLDAGDPARTGLGELVWRGGVELEAPGLGGLSALRWHDGRLYSVIDDGRWAAFVPVEQGGMLTGIRDLSMGDLLGPDGEKLAGKAAGDAESLTRSARGGWLVGFERDHRIWRYPTLSSRAEPTGIDPQTILGVLNDNSGVEALAGDERSLFLCAERVVDFAQPNCLRQSGGIITPAPVRPPDTIAALGGVPTDADRGADGTTYVLFRSYSPADGSGAAIMAIGPDLERRTLAVLRPPLTLDNMEGLAVREEAGRTFLYLVSDDNFSSRQRTLLLKVEIR